MSQDKAQLRSVRKKIFLEDDRTVTNEGSRIYGSSAIESPTEEFSATRAQIWFDLKPDRPPIEHWQSTAGGI